MNLLFKPFSVIVIICLSTNISHAIPDDGNRGSSSSSKSSSSSSSSKSTNTGNNPGNANAAGYGSGGNSPTGSSASKSSSSSSSSSKSTSSSSSGSASGSKSSGSSAGSSSSGGSGDSRSDSSSMTRAQASQYTSGMQTTPTKTTTTTATKGGLESSKSTSTTSKGMTKGEATKYTSSMQTSPSSSSSTPMTRAEATKYTSNMQPSLPKSSTDVAAAQAGADYMARYTTGTLGAGSLGFQQAQERLNYRGVTDYYTKNNVTGGTIPTGPLAEKYGNYAVANDPEMAAIDANFRSGKANVVTTTSGVSEQHMRELIGSKTYDSLSNTQKYGLYNSDLAIGNLSNVINDPQTGGYYDNHKNITVIDTNSSLGNTQVGMEKVTVHELQHAGDYTTYNRAQEVLNNPKSSSSDKHLAQETVDALEAVINGYVYEDVSKFQPNQSTAFTFDTPSEVRAQQFKEYLADVAEVRSFSSTPANRMQWAQNFALAGGVSVPEALELLDALAEAEGLLDDNSVQNEFIDKLGNK